jgi:hypothetical protein
VREKCLPLYLPPDVYRRLEQRALAEEREPVQQARWLLRQVLEDDQRAAASASAARDMKTPPSVDG